MSIPIVSYENFSTSNQAAIESGGPWIVSPEVPATAILTDNATEGCGSENQSWCGGYCLSCHVYPGLSPPALYPSFVTNISVNLTEYGGATSFGFIWNYWPLYCGSNTTTGSEIPITSQVGDAKFDESFPSVNYTTFFNGPNGGHEWDNASKIYHNGSTSVVRGSDPNRGYIAIKINTTMPFIDKNHDDWLNFYIKGIGFQITPLQSATAASSSSTSIQQAYGSSSSTAPAGVVAGAVVGALAFVVLFILAVCLFQRRRKKGENPVDDTVIFTKQVKHEAPALLDEGAVPPPHLATRYSAQPTSPASLRPSSVFADGSYGPPPTYVSFEPTGQDRVPLTPSSPELARFAAANREAINENLEARLQAAGYVPSQDPSRLTPDEWKNEYGITKLELDRLQNLYERAQHGQRQ